MPSTHIAADIVSPSLHDLLHLAADRATAELSSTDGTPLPDVREQLTRLVLLGLAVTGELSSMDFGETQAMSRPAVPRHYAAALRRALLSVVIQEGGAVGAAELAALITALDAVESPHGNDRPNEFTRHLSSSQSVNAVVEIAHDMRSPLTSILFLVETLRRGRSGPVTTVQERQLGLIYGAALGLNTLACDVIDAVRGGQRLVDGRPIPFSVAEVMLGVCDTVRPISEEKGLPITHILPAVDGRIGYPGALGRVLLNLMTNALKYTNEGSVTIGATELSETRMSFWVSDTGQGIPPSVMGMLFDGFRPSASGIRFSNAGLGLAICQDFLGSMGSTLQVDSTPETGTRFSFEIDLRRA
ncbi:MAG: HAMP domain-containing sensor histidine kinase [Gemmatimonadota bacterium]